MTTAVLRRMASLRATPSLTQSTHILIQTHCTTAMLPVPGSVPRPSTPQGIAAKNSRAEFSAPCRTTKFPRDIPPLPWYRATLPQMAMAGFLPFSAIYIELYYIFASIWGHKARTLSVLLQSAAVHNDWLLPVGAARTVL